MTISKLAVDPELHTLRSLARACTDGRARQDLESARFQLYAAIDAEDPELAQRWLRACRAALLALDMPDAREAGFAALNSIERAIKVQP